MSEKQTGRLGANRGVLMLVSLDDVNVDHEYQRDFRTEHAERLADKWNDSLVVVDDAGEPTGVLSIQRVSRLLATAET